MKKFFVIVSLFFSFNAFACNDLLDTEMRILDSSETLNLCEYENNVILVVNVASRCGYTYQYASLQKLYERYRENDFVILGIPSRDFMQEYSSEEDVAEFCSTEYGVNFPMFATSKVRGKKASPLYKKNCLMRLAFLQNGISTNTLFLEMDLLYQHTVHLLSLIL